MCFYKCFAVSNNLYIEQAIFHFYRLKETCVLIIHYLVQYPFIKFLINYLLCMLNFFLFIFVFGTI